MTETSPTTPETTAYRVTKPFWDGPNLRHEGDVLQLTPEQAKYRGDEIEPMPAAGAKRRAVSVAAAE